MTRAGPTATQNPPNKTVTGRSRPMHLAARQPRMEPAAAGPGGEDVAPAYFAAVHETFRHAGQAVGGLVDRFYTIGGYPIRLRFAGSALLPLIAPTLAHLEAPAPHPAPMLTVCLWDYASTRAAPPPPVWGTDDQGNCGEVPGYNDGRISTVFDRGSNVLSMLDRELDLALFWVRDPEEPLPYYEIAAPLRVILYWWMGDHGRRLIHAGAVGITSGGVLLAGRGGSGKSTTALCCLLSGMLYAGDDYVLVGTEPVPFVHSLYNSGKLHADQLRRFPQLLSATSAPRRPDEEKALLLLHEHFGERVAAGFPLRAILLPHVTGTAKTRLRETTTAASLVALAPSTIFQMPNPGPVALRQIARFVEQVPSYVVELGQDVADVPRLVAGLLSELRGP
jgi:hypothetical protein